MVSLKAEDLRSDTKETPKLLKKGPVPLPPCTSALAHIYVPCRPEGNSSP